MIQVIYIEQKLEGGAAGVTSSISSVITDRIVLHKRLLQQLIITISICALL